MGNRKNYHYFVEGADEKCVINALKTELQCIVPGKVEEFNVIQNHFPPARIRALKTGTIVILVFDTDKGNDTVLNSNIEFLKKQYAVKDVICIPQVKNLEEELEYSCNIKNVRELTGSSSIKDFKRDILTCTNVGARLKKCGFSIDKFWSRNPVDLFENYMNDAAKIKFRMRN